MRIYYTFDTGEIVHTGNDPDKCYFDAPNQPPITWASFRLVIKHRLANKSAHRSTKAELKKAGLL